MQRRPERTSKTRREPRKLSAAPITKVDVPSMQPNSPDGPSAEGGRPGSKDEHVPQARFEAPMRPVRRSKPESSTARRFTVPAARRKPRSSKRQQKVTASGALLGAESANHYSSVQLLRVNSSCHQPRRRHDSSGSCGLAFTGFNGDKSGGIQPLRGFDDDPAVEAQTVRAAVERDPRLMDPGLGRHRRQHIRGNVRSVDHNELHLPPEPGRECRIQIPLVDLPT